MVVVDHGLMFRKAEKLPELSLCFSTYKKLLKNFFYTLLYSTNIILLIICIIFLHLLPGCFLWISHLQYFQFFFLEQICQVMPSGCVNGLCVCRILTNGLAMQR